MNITKVIAKLEAIRDEHGELDVLVTDDQGRVVEADSFEYELVDSDDLYPDDYNMPSGTEFVNIQLY